MIDEHGNHYSNPSRPNAHLNNTLLQTSALTFNQPEEDQTKLSPADRLLARDTAAETSGKYIATTALRATCRATIDSLHRPEFWQSPHLTKQNSERSRFDAEGFPACPSSNAILFGVFNAAHMLHLARTTSGLILGAYFLERAIQYDDVAPLSCFDQIGGGNTNTEIGNVELASMAAKLFLTFADPVMVRPDRACTSLEIITAAERNDCCTIWSPLNNLLSLQKNEERYLDSVYGDELRQSAKRKLKRLSSLPAQPPLTGDLFLNSILSNNAITALAYGGYYQTKMSRPRLHNLTVNFGGPEQAAWSHQWEDLLNHCLSR